MTRNYDADLVAKSLRSVSRDVGVAGAFPVRKDGIQNFMIMSDRLLTADEMISLCRELAMVIRREIPERPDGWAARILAGNHSATIMGDYYIGWAGRADEWHLREGQDQKAADLPDWQAFRSRLRVAIAAMGTEGEETSDRGDFSVAEGESGRHTVFVNNPEFLTKELITTIQNLLRDGRPDGVVKIFPSFGKLFETLWEGLYVRSDRVVERWDRQEAEQLLGDRLKIPRYARDDS